VSAFAWAQLDEIAPVVQPDPGEPEWRPVRHHFGIRAFGVNAWVAREAGDLVIEEHDERGDGSTAEHEELYLVVEGRARFTVAGETLDAPAGTLVYVADPALVRKAVADTAGTTVLAIGAAPGVAFSVSPWEAKYVAA
jgi:hypothetical protein